MKTERTATYTRVFFGPHYLTFVRDETSLNGADWVLVAAIVCMVAEFACAALVVVVLS